MYKAKHIMYQWYQFRRCYIYYFVKYFFWNIKRNWERINICINGPSTFHQIAVSSFQTFKESDLSRGFIKTSNYFKLDH